MPSRHTVRMMAVMIAVALALAAPSKAKERSWQNGTLVSLTKQHSTGVTGSNGRIDSYDDDVWTYSLDGGGRLYEGEWMRRPIRGLEVNGPVRFAPEGRSLYVRDQSGGTHRLRLVKTTVKK